jgi:hypothetical protein
LFIILSVLLLVIILSVLLLVIILSVLLLVIIFSVLLRLKPSEYPLISVHFSYMTNTSKYVVP